MYICLQSICSLSILVTFRLVTLINTGSILPFLHQSLMCSLWIIYSFFILKLFLYNVWNTFKNRHRNHFINVNNFWSLLTQLFANYKIHIRILLNTWNVKSKYGKVAMLLRHTSSNLMTCIGSLVNFTLALTILYAYIPTWIPVIVIKKHNHP